MDRPTAAVGHMPFAGHRTQFDLLSAGDRAERNKQARDYEKWMAAGAEPRSGFVETEPRNPNMVKPASGFVRREVSRYTEWGMERK